MILCSAFLFASFVAVSITNLLVSDVGQPVLITANCPNGQTEIIKKWMVFFPGE